MEGVESEAPAAIGGVERKTMLIGAVIVLVIILILLGYYFWSRSSDSTKSTSQLPAPKQQPFPDGSVVRCDTTGGIYKVENGLLRHYSFERYVAAGKPAAQNVSCETLASMQQGNPM
jgi:hypothetical protein